MKTNRLISLIGACCLAGAAMAQSYIVTPIIEGDPEGLNQGGAVCGTGYYNGVWRAFVWRPSAPNGTAGTLAALPLYKSNHKNPRGLGLNNLGDVVGASNYAGGFGVPTPQAVIWPRAGGAPINIGPGTNTQSEAYDINDSGNVALMVNSASGVQLQLSKVVSGKRKLFPVGKGWPGGINNLGQIVSRLVDGFEPYIWTPSSTNGSTGTSTLLTSASWAYDLNENGEAVGESPTPDSGYTPAHPFIYLPVPAYGLSAGMNDISSQVFGGLPAPPSGRWASGGAAGTNDSGTVVGNASAWDFLLSQTTDRAAWIWDPVNGGRKLAVPGWDILSAWKVNNAGQILCSGTQDGGATRWAILLTPQ